MPKMVNFVLKFDISFLNSILVNFDFLAPEVVDILKRVQGLMHSNVVSSKSLDVVFKMIDFILQSCNKYENKGTK
jgi:hypothetical protein